MKIVSLFLQNVRKYEECSFEFVSSERNQQFIIVGPNGSGKTTILESIIYPLRGFLYGNSDQKFIKKGETNAEISIHLLNEFSDEDSIRSKHEIRAKIDISGKSSFYVNKKECTREGIRRFGDVFWFFPQDILIILGGEGERRNYLDTILKISDPAFKKIMKEYSYSLKARNAILKKAEHVEEVYQNKELDAVEEVLARLGNEIIERRTRLVEELNGLVEKVLQSGMEKLNLKLQYATSFKSTSDIQESLLEALYVSRGTDYFIDATSVGPHRDKLYVYIKHRGARYEASYGERKLAAFALKVAGYLYIRLKRTENIIFLADDIFSELDSYHKRMIIDLLVSNCNSFFATATEMNEEHARSFGLELLNLGG